MSGMECESLSLVLAGSRPLRFRPIPAVRVSRRQPFNGAKSAVARPVRPPSGTVESYVLEASPFPKKVLSAEDEAASGVGANELARHLFLHHVDEHLPGAMHGDD